MTHSVLHDIVYNVLHNLFKPLLLFFYMGFLVPLLKVPFDFPRPVYQGITMYLLIAIGWHGGEELASLGWKDFLQAGGFMVVGFLTNTMIAFAAYLALRAMTNLRRVDAATVAGYYGSDSAGTFVTCVGVLTGLGIAYSQYMPVMLAVMEIPGCLVALYLVSRLRHQGMDARGNMPDEPGYVWPASQANGASEPDWHEGDPAGGRGRGPRVVVGQRQAAAGSAVAHASEPAEGAVAVAVAEDPPVEEAAHAPRPQQQAAPRHGRINWHLVHEVLLNPGLFLLFGGIVIGFVSRLQGANVTAVDDPFFITMFQGILCLFLLEMGMTACQRLRDLKSTGFSFIAFGLVAPNVFAITGILIAHAYATLLQQPLPVGTYVLFAVLCGAASYIAVPAVQRLAIPEASPTLPLAASLGLTFSYNVTVGIPVYLEIAKAITQAWPVIASTTGA